MDKIEELEQKIDALTKVINAQNRILTKIAKSMYLVPMSDKEAERLEVEKRKNAETVINAHHQVDERTPKEDFVGIFGELPEDSDIYADVIADDLR